MDDILRDFLAESLDLCEVLDHALMGLESDPHNKELLNKAFRAFHTIKGGAGFVAAKALVEICHAAENTMDLARSDQIQITKDVLELLLTATANANEYLAQMQAGTAPVDLLVLDEGLVSKLQDPTSITIGVDHVELSDSQALRTDSSVEDFRQIAGTADQDEIVELDPRRPDDYWMRLLMLVNGGVTPDMEPRDADSAFETAPLRVAQSSVSPSRPSAATRSSQALAPVDKTSSIRVATEKLDELLELAGEIRLSRNRLSAVVADLSSMMAHRSDMEQDQFRVLQSVVDSLSRQVAHLETVSMRTRMVSVGTVFSKFHRLVRDTSNSLQKEVELHLEGEETEIDKVMVDALYEPLVHMVRNAVDHGIERPSIRLQRGKPVCGRIYLSARQEGGQIYIEMADDGAGMDASKIIEKAVEKGLVDGGANLSNDQAYALIFLPGFSTKGSASDLSGRGVGMDVVKTTAEKMRGKVSVTSTPGEGSKISIVLPLTLSLIEVLLVRCNDRVLGLPLSDVVEVITIRYEDIYSLSGRPVISYKDVPLDFPDLGELIGDQGCDGSKAVVAKLGDLIAAVRISDVIGYENMVIKPSTHFELPLVSGLALSSHGKVVPILNTAKIFSQSYFI
jgi:two-component system chemotaxis sensor kinase CheA